MFAEIRYFIDPETDQPHIYHHHVAEYEIEELFRNKPLNQEGRRSDSGMKTFIATGRTCAGRFLKVVYSVDEDRMGIFIVTAYDLRGKDLKAYRRRLRRRNS